MTETTTLISAATCVCLALLLYLFYNGHYYHRQSRDQRFVSDSFPNPIATRALIAGKHPKQLNILTAQESRAIANGRHRAFFGVDNAFTSPDEGCVKRFVGHAGGLIRLVSEEWDIVATMVRRAVQQSVGCTCDKGYVRVYLINLVQVVTMRATLRILFKINEDVVLGIPDEKLINLANAINQVWMVSKSAKCKHGDGDGKYEKLPRFEDNEQLRDCLSAIFPDTQIKAGQNNPLNLIIPGFETLWRIVLRVLLETGYTTGVQHPEWRDVFVAFVKNPTSDQFSTGSVSAEMIVNEGLRLYPPTRRIHRAFKLVHLPGSCLNDTEILPADIEASHTAPHIWGSTATKFNPGRWSTAILTREQRNAFMPFGSKPFVCPAQGVFGPRAIAVIVGALLENLCSGNGGLGGGWVLDKGGGGVRAGERLSNERDAYGDLCLVRRA